MSRRRSHRIPSEISISHLPHPISPPPPHYTFPHAFFFFMKYAIFLGLASKFSIYLFAFPFSWITLPTCPQNLSYLLYDFSNFEVLFNTTKFIYKRPTQFSSIFFTAIPILLSLLLFSSVLTIQTVQKLKGVHSNVASLDPIKEKSQGDLLFCFENRILLLESRFEPWKKVIRRGRKKKNVSWHFLFLNGIFVQLWNFSFGMTNSELALETTDLAKSRGSGAILKNSDPDSFAFASPVKGPKVHLK